MSAWVSAAPVIGTSSLDGFAIGALMSGTCALAITGPRRARRPSAARGGAAQATERSGWLCEHVMAAEAIGSGVAAETVAAGPAAGAGLTAGAFGPGAERLARPDELGGQGKGRIAGGRDSKAPGGYQSRHRREAHPGMVFPDAEFSARTLQSPRRPEARRMPRHAAPSVSLSSRVTGLGSRMTGLFATRALAGGARG